MVFRVLFCLFVIAHSVNGNAFSAFGTADDDAQSSAAAEVAKKDELNVGEYCAAFRINFNYYCRGIWTLEKLQKNSHHYEKIQAFCPNYKKNCIEETAAKRGLERAKTERRRRLLKAVGDLNYDEIMQGLAGVVPCRRNCDHRLHPHCTPKCKCEYELERMKDWCKPPQVSALLISCRMWEYECASFLPENYASIYVQDRSEDQSEEKERKRRRF
ncbi:unnamed protein product [Caenorhabditis auriculariae]|uniref:Uncharacterized protein n=1 Tax=Caenorhabditis auriculariae TaxID=2777116 RepID=A0A8S1I020_9PELO|nr:unnamed protein product [Caenorhabditis auriculariae]